MVSKYFLQFFEWLKNFYFYFGNFICVHPVFRSYSPPLSSPTLFLFPRSPFFPTSSPPIPMPFCGCDCLHECVWGGRLPEHDLHGDSPADESRVPLKLSFEAPEKCPFWGPTALNLDRESFSSDFLSLLLLIFFLFRDKK